MAGRVPDLAVRGKDVQITLFVDGRPQEQTDNATSVNVNEVNTQHVEKLLGRTQDRLDETPGHFELAFDGYFAKSQIYAALQAVKAARAANQRVPTVALGLIYTMRDGTKGSFIASTCTTNQTLKIGGKDEAVMHSLKIQAETFVQQDL